MLDVLERRPNLRDVQADMMRLTLEIVAKTLFDAEIGSDTAGASAAYFQV